MYISKTVTVRGGYTTTNWTTPDPEANPTTLDAQGLGRVVVISGTVSAGAGQAITPTLEGLRITGGDATGFVWDCLSTRVDRCWRRGVRLHGHGHHQRCVVVSNTASTVFWGYGGGLYLRSSNTTLPPSSGAGLYVSGSAPRLRHNTVANNTGGDGSGIYVTDYDLWGGTYSAVVLTDTILVSHTIGITVTAGSTATLEATLWYSNGTNTGGGGVITSANAITADPAFVDPSAWDYHRSAVSAGIDAGVDAGVTRDIDGDPRIWPYDIGADEVVKRFYLPMVLRND